MKKVLSILLILALALGCFSFVSAAEVPIKSFAGEVFDFEGYVLEVENAADRIEAFDVEDITAYNAVTGEADEDYDFAVGEACKVLFTGDLADDFEVLCVLVNTDAVNAATNTFKIGELALQADDPYLKNVGGTLFYFKAKTALYDCTQKLLDRESLAVGQVVLAWTHENADQEKILDKLIVLGEVKQDSYAGKGAVVDIDGDLVTIAFVVGSQEVELVLDCEDAEFYLGNASTELDRNLKVGDKVKAWYELYEGQDYDGICSMLIVDPKAEPVTDEKEAATKMVKIVIGEITAKNGGFVIKSPDGAYVLTAPADVKITGKNHKDMKVGDIPKGTCANVFVTELSGSDPVKGEITKIVLTNKNALTDQKGKPEKEEKPVKENNGQKNQKGNK